MKYYCKNCGREFNSAHTFIYSGMRCKCGKKTFERIPEFETPKHYEARTGKPWPDNGLVWCLMDTVLIDWHLTQFRKIENGRLYINGHYVGIKAVICAQGPEAPPNDWIPEE